jgi:histidyl-tRNA synthetase
MPPIVRVPPVGHEQVGGLPRTGVIELGRVLWAQVPSGLSRRVAEPDGGLGDGVELGELEPLAASPLVRQTVLRPISKLGPHRVGVGVPCNAVASCHGLQMRRMWRATANHGWRSNRQSSPLPIALSILASVSDELRESRDVWEPCNGTSRAAECCERVGRGVPGLVDGREGSCQRRRRGAGLTLHAVQMRSELEDGGRRLPAASSEVVTELPPDLCVVEGSEFDLRAAAAGILNALARPGLGVRVQVLEALQDMLNSRRLSKNVEAPSLEGFASGAVSVAAALLEALGGLTRREMTLVLAGQGCESGMAAVAAAVAGELCVCADAIAALTIDAFELSGDAAAFVDPAGVTEGRAASGTMIRNLLESSTRAGAGGAPTGAADMNGCARDAAKSGARKARLLLHEGPIIASPGEAASGLLDASVVRKHGALVQAAERASDEAIEFLAQGIDQRLSLATSGASSRGVAGRALLDRVRAVSALLLEEGTVAVARISEIESVAMDAFQKKEAARLERAKEHQEAEARRVAAMSDAQRAAYEAKQAKAAAKASKKGKAVEKKPSSGVGRGVGFLVQRLGEDLTSLFPMGTVGEGERLAALAERCAEEVATEGVDPKIAKGTRDYGPEEMRVRQPVFAAIRSVFSRHGAVEIDTPVFERRETLTGKYGEEGGKLIYDLADQGGELLSLRYDLTVPFARFVAMRKLEKLKRFHIARVYRRDTPSISRGRFREFYQCDFDIAGEYAPMVPDAEVVTVAVEILRSLPVGDFTVKLNHRGILDGMLELAGVPSGKVRTVCSSIDKLDKEPWDAVRAELVGEKGVAPATADRIGVLVQRSGRPRELLSALTDEGVFAGSDKATSAMSDLRLMFEYLDALGTLDAVTLDLSLARGLDYYTGVIYEVVLLDGTTPVGSIAAGGRYDGLVGMFSASKSKVPCVGVSIGIERVFAIVEKKAREADSEALSRPPVDVLVASTGGGVSLEDRLRLCRELWAGGVRAETPSKEKMEKRWLENALEAGYPFICVLGEDEVASGTVTVKRISDKTQISVPRADIVTVLAELGVELEDNKAALRARELAGEALPAAAE